MSATSNAGVPAELWEKHGVRKSFESQKRYKKADTTRLLSVSRAAMGTPNTPALDVRVECESVGAPPVVAEDDQPPDDVGVPPGAFALS